MIRIVLDFSSTDAALEAADILAAYFDSTSLSTEDGLWLDDRLMTAIADSIRQQVNGEKPPAGFLDDDPNAKR